MRRLLPEHRFLRFLIVGGINTVFGYSLYAGLLFIGLHYSLAVALGTVGGVLFNYFTTGRLVFEHRGRSRLPQFVGVYVVVYLANTGSLWLFDRAGVDLYLAGALLILPMALLAYLLQRRFVFAD